MSLITTMITALLLLAGNALCAPALPAGNPASGTLQPSAGHFLVAARGLHGPYFSRTVIYLVQHNSAGSAGVIVNRPLGKKVADVLPDMSSIELGTYPVYIGGPVNPRIMVMLFKGNYQTDLAVHISGDVYASSYSAMLTQLVAVHKPGNELRMYAGQAGWAPGQLARELEQGSWHVIEGDPEVIFSGDTDKLWKKLINQLDPQGIMALNQTGLATAAGLQFAFLNQHPRADRHTFK